jgi:RNA polymerase sigma-70 factor (ECF subfamily)
VARPASEVALSPVPCAPEADSARDEQRLRALVTSEHPFIWRTLRRLCVRESELDDATQQVFLVAARKLSDIKAGSERSFLFQTALRVAADARRTQRRRREVYPEDLTAVADERPDPETLADRTRARALLDRLLEEMPLPLRAVFVLYEIEELSGAQIAELMELPQGTVASRLRRAREMFQDGLGRLRAGEEP